MSAPHSTLCQGTLRHRRFRPKFREFKHSVLYFLLDMKEIPRLLNLPLLFWNRAPALFSWERKNFFGTNPNLDEELRQGVQERLGFKPTGKIQVLCQLGSLGYGFNPVCFYFFRLPSGRLEAILSEITNTPWDERHAYAQDCRDLTGPRYVFNFPKRFHVSPFLSMDYLYRWTFHFTENSIAIHMENYQADVEGPPAFDATLTLRQTSWSGGALAKALLNQPLMTLKTAALIYLHAAVLWVRKFPFYSHPRHSEVKS